MSTLNLVASFLAYADSSASNQPSRKNVDWKRSISGLSVSNAHSEEHALAALETKTIFSGTRATSIDGTTTFALTLSPLSSSRYRITYTAGQVPGFRTDRNLALSGSSVTVVSLVNGSATWTISAGVGTFAGVVAGDTVYVPGVKTGDTAGPFSDLNAGFWQVLAVLSATSLSMSRLTGEIYEGASETAAVTANTQVQAYSAAGVQTTDKMEISAGFASTTRQTFPIEAVTSTWVEIISTLPLPIESGIQPGAAGMSFYSSTKRLVYIESDQELLIRANGDTGSTQRLAPFEAGNADLAGAYLKVGPCWSLTLVNRASVVANVLLVLAE